MATDNRFVREELQAATPLPPDAYEVYWSFTENEGHAGRPFASSDSLQSCSPGDAYNKLWQLWDAQ